MHHIFSQPKLLFLNTTEDKAEVLGFGLVPPIDIEYGGTKQERQCILILKKRYNASL